MFEAKIILRFDHVLWENHYFFGFPHIGTQTAHYWCRKQLSWVGIHISCATSHTFTFKNKPYPFLGLSHAKASTVQYNNCHLQKEETKGRNQRKELKTKEGI